MVGDVLPATKCLDRIAERASRTLDPTAAAQIMSFVYGCASSDGGYRGRGTDSDLYYTHFAVESLHALGSVSQRNALPRYLEAFADGEFLDYVHRCCLVRILSRLPCTEQRTARIHRVLESLEKWRRKDGGYNLGAESHGSVYAGFLALLAHGASDSIPFRPDELLSWIGDRMRGDGSWSDEPGASQGTTTVTAAAAVTLAVGGKSPTEATVRWLLSRQNPEGGFTASPMVSVADLLSTATALTALRLVGHCGPDVASAAADYISGLWARDGGFCGHALDGITDCEYCYWALLGLGATVDAA